MGIIEINRHPSPKELRSFGILLLIFVGVVGAVLRWRADAPTVAAMVWGLGGSLVAVHALAPRSRR